MERVGTLINKLKEQYDQHADAGRLTVTASLLLAELQLLQQQVGNTRTGKVAVVMPGFTNSIPAAPQPVMAPVAKPVPVREPEPVREARELSEEPNGWLYDTPVEIPTLMHQEPVAVPVKEVYELNESMMSDGGNSMNEKLREERVEIAAALQGAPIRDLKKVIGINDRYLFVNDLFRGDENMYERSMKTINGFNIYPEAQYWIQRELKVKMGWNEGSETVKLFDQIVKRRFS
ncbi:hypothetical protein [Sediminibacterium ginsengisoli]|uniref:Uncharacterized protein n=1 Tax=Sediminibacterium ginsengisoli TaxID=413434 RepID=A0A1T4QDK6_9BACT|nr:hypothetical protein [Sediminibacterium ginsengisoli]SKA01706.1 hypothetical protein SAMN04488132_10862 [Sediminibacterium ginsengisoli]